METMLSPCGLDCLACPALIATRNNDMEALGRLVVEWERQFGFKGKPEDARCTGCLSEGVKIGHCAECAMRLCALQRKLATCADCPDYGCAKNLEFFAMAPDAKKRLDALRK